MQNSPVTVALLVFMAGTCGYVRADSGGEVFAGSRQVAEVAAISRVNGGGEVKFSLAKEFSDQRLLLAQDAGISSPGNGTHPKPRGRLVKVHRVTLSWQPSVNGLTSGDAVTYNVYRCSDAISSSCAQINFEPVTSPSYVDDRVRSGETYYYATTAVDQNGRQSRISNVVKVVIPFP